MKPANKDLLNEKIAEIAEYDIKEKNVFGSAYIVCRNGKKLCERYFGIAKIEGKIPVNADTLFRIASMSKPVTAVTMLILIDRGKISLKDPVKKYIPEFEKIHIIGSDGIDYGKPKTEPCIMHLLTHTSGFGCKDSTKMSKEDKESIKKTVRFHIGAGLDFEPFSNQKYSSTGAFDVLAEIVEEVTGDDYESFLKREIFIPCDMKNTTFIPSETQWKNIIDMHTKSNARSCFEKMPESCIFEDFPVTHKLAGGGLVSTAKDYSKFAEMLLNKGKTSYKKIVSEKTFSLLPFPYVPEKIMPGNES